MICLISGLCDSQNGKRELNRASERKPLYPAMSLTPQPVAL